MLKGYNDDTDDFASRFAGRRFYFINFMNNPFFVSSLRSSPPSQARKHPQENRPRINGKALTIDPDAYSQLGNMLYQSKQYRSALDDGFLRCLQSMGNPKSNVNGQLDAVVGGGGIAGIYNMCGLCHTSLGDYEEGKDAFITALTIDQGFKEVRNSTFSARHFSPVYATSHLLALLACLRRG